MSRYGTRTYALLGAGLGLGLALTAAAPAAALAPDAFDLFLPAGTACADIDLGIDVGSDGNARLREFTDRDGDVVRTLETGTGSTLTVTNAVTGDAVTFPSSGSASTTTLHADGSATVESRGHRLFVLFPSDVGGHGVPPGPSTSLLVGRVVYTVTPDGVFEVQSSSGRTTDVCALLAP